MFDVAVPRGSFLELRPEEHCKSRICALSRLTESASKPGHSYPATRVLLGNQGTAAPVWHSRAFSLRLTSRVQQVARLLRL